MLEELRHQPLCNFPMWQHPLGKIKCMCLGGGISSISWANFKCYVLSVIFSRLSLG